MKTMIFPPLLVLLMASQVSSAWADGAPAPLRMVPLKYNVRYSEFGGPAGGSRSICAGTISVPMFKLVSTGNGSSLTIPDSSIIRCSGLIAGRQTTLSIGCSVILYPGGGVDGTVENRKTFSCQADAQSGDVLFDRLLSANGGAETTDLSLDDESVFFNSSELSLDPMITQGVQFFFNFQDR
jgi:hypothetical protein